MKVVFFYLLVGLAVAELQILSRSNLDTRLVTTGFSTSLAIFHNSYHPNMVGPGAFWIWNNEGYASPPGRTLTFQVLFYADCATPIQLNITADDRFKVYFDGKVVATGNNWRYIYSLQLDSSCGSHNLTVIVEQDNSQYGPGLIFILSQDQTSCYNCGLNGVWDYSRCRCSCLTICGCAKPQFWMDYPVCSCRCPIKKLSSTSNQLQQRVYSALLNRSGVDLAQSSDSLCDKNQFYNHQTCKCECKPKYCPRRYYWNSDPKVCSCIFMP